MKTFTKSTHESVPFKPSVGSNQSSPSGILGGMEALSSTFMKIQTYWLGMHILNMEI